MERPVNQRIIELKDFLKTFKVNLEAVTGVGKSTITNIRKNRNYPGYEVIEAIVQNCEHPDTRVKLSARWLITGEGGMWERKEEDPIAELQENYKNINRRLAELEKHIKEL